MVSRKVRLFTWRVLHGCFSTLDKFIKKLPLMVGPFCCILSESGGRLRLLWRCHFVSNVWDFFPTFVMSCACQRDVGHMIEEFLHLPFGEGGRFLWHACVCAIVGYVG